MLARTALWGNEGVKQHDAGPSNFKFFSRGVVGDVFTRFTKQPFAYAADLGFPVAHGLQTLLPDCAEIKGEYLMELSVHGLT